MEESIEQLAKFLCADDKPAELLILPCRGIIKDPLRDRYGFLFRPPAYIKDLRGSRLSPGAISRLRKPIPLLELLDQTARSSKNLLDLGIRFKLARQLVQSIYILHAAGWVHKKYFLFSLCLKGIDHIANREKYTVCVSSISTRQVSKGRPIEDRTQRLPEPSPVWLWLF